MEDYCLNDVCKFLGDLQSSDLRVALKSEIKGQHLRLYFRRRVDTIMTRRANNYLAATMIVCRGEGGGQRMRATQPVDRRSVPRAATGPPCLQSQRVSAARQSDRHRHVVLRDRDVYCGDRRGGGSVGGRSAASAPPHRPGSSARARAPSGHLGTRGPKEARSQRYITR